MMTFDTIEQLTKYGMDPRKARRTVLIGVLPVQLDVPNHTDNLELLAAHTDLNECIPELIWRFLKRDFSVNQRLASLPKFFNFPEEDAKAYLSRPLDWGRDVQDWYQCEEALKLLTDDADLIHKILSWMFCRGVHVYTEEFKAICRQLDRINTDPAAMENLLRQYHYTLFSYYSRTWHCIDLLIKVFGIEKSLDVLVRYPFLPKDVADTDWSIFRDITPEKFEALLQKGIPFVLIPSERAPYFCH